MLTKPKSAADMRDKLATVGAKIVNKGDWLRIGSNTRVRWADLEARDFLEDFDETDLI